MDATTCLGGLDAAYLFQGCYGLRVLDESVVKKHGKVLEAVIGMDANMQWKAMSHSNMEIKDSAIQEIMEM